MVGAGGSSSSDARGGDRGYVGPSPRGENSLESALERLSLNLERIQSLLVELQASRRPRSSGTQLGHEQEPRVVHGGGPSAFTRRTYDR